MGCAGSKSKEKAGSQVRKPKPWKHPTPITRGELKKMREEFWDTAPHYGGQREIWDALRVAAEGDPAFAETIIESAGIILPNGGDLSTCYDERGAKYDLPHYVLSDPVNLVKDDTH
ncbi:Ubiquitin domain-containing protein [Klebsormidium nitens]|uniref:Ubiquitin domain-containing protein n=1 Tax=Klebsormidium nitens TaxID=105231 RepID=A0A1Y1HP18_KLENI|nr:Ubiquitin domain-containing protein [Klebsormidium nitens]|eukprot:GAQ78711.1 Ubiquitin domain-containing protein [Klebsormidium nitens]